MSHGSSAAAYAGERDPDHALTAGLAHVPPSLSTQAHRVLGNEHGPAPAWPRAQPGLVGAEGLRGARNAESGAMAEGAPVAARLEPYGIGVRDAVAAIEVECHDVEDTPVMLGAAAAGAPGRR